MKLRVVEIEPTVQPELPEFTVQVKVDGQLVEQEFVWPEPTRDWWRLLALHPLRPEFVEADWSYLMDTALLHAGLWQGKLIHAAELRLREAKYGFTPDDRARLRVQFAQALSAEVSTAAKVSGARDRFPSMVIEDEIPAPTVNFLTVDDVSKLDTRTDDFPPEF